MQASFIPSTECEEDTSYFACRHAWNSADVQIHASSEDFDCASDTSNISCCSSPYSYDEDEDVWRLLYFLILLLFLFLE